ncbi:SAF domain-containing protein [bacterium]|nr:SAF domain-containing protein [bacterium]
MLIYFYISNLKSAPTADPDSKEVLISKEEISKGSEIELEMIIRQKISKNIFSSKFISNENEIIGKKAKDTILKGEIISKDKIIGVNDSSDKNLKFSAYIPLSENAVTIPVTYWGDISLINIGDKVDIISTYYEKENGILKSEIVLDEKEIVIISRLQDSDNENMIKDSGLSILNSGSNAIRADDRILYLTFYLNKEEVTEIFSAIEKGNLNIALCSSRTF